MKQFIIAVTFVATIAVSSHAWYRAMTNRGGVPTPDLQAIVLPQPRTLSGFELTDQRDQRFGHEQLTGHWSMLFFGYTSCPDICPTTMLTLQNVARDLAQAGQPAPAMVLVSVDPERDDRATLDRYVRHFGDEFIGVRGRENELQALTRQVGAMYERDTPDDSGYYQVAHSGSLFVVNPAGGLHAVFSAPHDASRIAKKMLAITNQYGRP